MTSKVFCAAIAVLAIAVGASTALATDVVTYHNDIARTGLNPNETILTLNNVNSASFGKLFTIIAADPAAQPVRLSLVQVSGVHGSVIDQPTAHPPGGVRLRLDLTEPAGRIGGHVGGARVRDDMQQARVVNGHSTGGSSSCR